MDGETKNKKYTWLNLWERDRNYRRIQNFKTFDLIKKFIMNYTNEFPKNGDELDKVLKSLFPTRNAETKLWNDYPFWCPYDFCRPCHCYGYSTCFGIDKWSCIACYRKIFSDEKDEMILEINFVGESNMLEWNFLTDLNGGG